MIKTLESILIFSDDAGRLAEFYKDKLGLLLTMEAVMGDNEERVYIFKIGDEGPGLSIMDHSKIREENAAPERIMFNLEVDNIKKEVKRLEMAGVKKIKDIYHLEDYGYIATFADADNNYFQLVQTRAP